MPSAGVSLRLSPHSQSAYPGAGVAWRGVENAKLWGDGEGCSEVVQESLLTRWMNTTVKWEVWVSQCTVANFRINCSFQHVHNISCPCQYRSYKTTCVEESLLALVRRCKTLADGDAPSFLQRTEYSNEWQTEILGFRTLSIVRIFPK
jgi:hypothetical protein